MPLTSNKILMDLVTQQSPVAVNKRPLFRCITEGPLPQDNEEDPVEGINHTEVIFDSDVWRDMGSPRQITVTVEPGDTLNRD